MIEPFHVAGFIEDLQTRKAKPTVKQYLAAVRMLFEWPVIGHDVAANRQPPFAGRSAWSTKGRRRC